MIKRRSAAPALRSLGLDDAGLPLVSMKTTGLCMKSISFSIKSISFSMKSITFVYFGLNLVYSDAGSGQQRQSRA